MHNGVHLITYADRLGSGGIDGVRRLLEGPLAGVFTGVHFLPFFEPFDGADAGFDPVDHAKVDNRLGTWQDIAAVASSHELTADLIVNHVSDESPEFLDFKEHGEASAHAGMFLTRDKVFPGGATDTELGQIYRPRPGKPFTALKFGDDTVRFMWTTFTEHQIDIDVRDPGGWAYLCKILDRFAAAGIKQVRLDAIGYAAKQRGTSCFMIPETFEVIDDLTFEIHSRSMEVLVEIHGHYTQQLDIARQVDRVYDFALPPLVLHSLHTGSGTALRRWLEISPRNAMTVLDTHDGIGIVDVAAADGAPGLLADEEIDTLVEAIEIATNRQSTQATGSAASNLDLYQVNSTYFAAVGHDDNRYLLSRLIQFLSPGIPQIYYAGLLAADNDMELLARTGVGRDINRPYFNDAELEEALVRPVVKTLCSLARFRNSHRAFDGEFTIAEPVAGHLVMKWINDRQLVAAAIDLNELTFELSWSDTDESVTIDSWDELRGFD